MYFAPGAISPENAEQRADLGKKADFWDVQVFDGPAPETINGRAAMLGEDLPEGEHRQCAYHLSCCAPFSQYINNHPSAIAIMCAIQSMIECIWGEALQVSWSSGVYCTQRLVMHMAHA